MNHQERELAEPKLTLEEAKAKINAGLTVTGTAQAVIPTETGGEKFCYEFTCKAGGEDCIVYIHLRDRQRGGYSLYYSHEQRNPDGVKRTGKRAGEARSFFMEKSGSRKKAVARTPGR